MLNTLYYYWYESRHVSALAILGILHGRSAYNNKLNFVLYSAGSHDSVLTSRLTDILHSLFSIQLAVNSNY